MLPTYQAGVHIHSGELVRLLPHAEPRQMNIYAVYASRKHMPAALRSMLDFLVLRFPENPDWDEAVSKRQATSYTLAAPPFMLGACRSTLAAAST